MNLQKLILTALLMALCLVMTLAVQIPILGGGYIHPGDGFVLLSGVILGPGFGFLAAGIGSALADITLAFTAFAPATFIIKGLMALIVGLWPRQKPIYLLIGFIIAEALMVLGYFLYEWLIIFGNYQTALAGVPWNLTQAAGGVVIGFLLYLALSKTKLIKR